MLSSWNYSSCSVKDICEGAWQPIPRAAIVSSSPQGHLETDVGSTSGCQFECFSSTSRHHSTTLQADSAQGACVEYLPAQGMC